MGKTRFSVRLPANMARELHIIKEKEGIELSHMLREGMRMYLESKRK